MSQQGALTETGGAAPNIETLTGNSGGAVGPNAAFNVDVLGNNSTGINVVGTPASNLLTVLGISSSTTQIGTVELATSVETGTITDATRAITPAGLGPILISPYIVAPGGAYTTIQSALNAANAAGGGTVYVRPGSYTENLTLFDNTQIVGATGLGDFGALIITGVHTPPLTGSFVFRNVRLTSATHIFSSAAAGSSILTLIDVDVRITNGYLFNLLNWTGTFVTYDVADNSNDNGMVNNTGGATCFFISATHGAGTANSMVTSGIVVMQEVDLNCPWNAQTGTNFSCDYVIFSRTATLSNNSTGFFDFCRFTTGATAALTMSSSASVSLTDSVINSSNNPSIAGAGAGTLTLNNVSFLNNAVIAGTLTLGSSSLYPVSMNNGQLLIGSIGQPAVPATLTAGSNISIANGAGTITISANGGGELAVTALTNASSPYTVLSTDEYLTCNVSGGVLTIRLPNAPTTGRVVTIKDSGGNAATNNITVTTVGGVVNIDGAATFVMNTAYEAISVLFNGTSYEVF